MLLLNSNARSYLPCFVLALGSSGLLLNLLVNLITKDIYIYSLFERDIRTGQL